MNPAVAEAITATLVAFPCPPLPMLGGRRNGKEVIINTHDLLADFILNLLKLQNVELNNKRQQLQTKMEKEYMKEISRYSEDEIDKVYSLMVRYTINYMRLYFPEGTLDIRILPLEYVPGDIIKQVASYVRARQILLDKTPTPIEDFILSPKEIYRVCHQVIKDTKAS